MRFCEDAYSLAQIAATLPIDEITMGEIKVRGALGYARRLLKQAEEELGHNPEVEPASATGWRHYAKTED